MSLPDFQIKPADPIKTRLAANAKSDLANKARVFSWILILVGLFYIGASAYYVVKAEAIVDALIAKAVGPSADPTVIAERRASSIQKTKIMNSAGVAMGVVIAVLGVVARKKPVAATITAFVLYVAVMGGVGFIHLDSIRHGLLWKGVILLLLIVAIAQAQAYRKAIQAQADAG